MRRSTDISSRRSRRNGWDAIENPAFEFAIKANQAFTHAAGTKPSERKAQTSVESLKYSQTDIDQARRFLDVLAERDRLLVVLFQFPVSFKFTKKNKEGEAVRLEGNWDHVADVLNAFKEYPKAIEFRHETWDDPWVLNALREHDTAWVNIDEPRLGASLHGTDYVTAPIAYLRLHGRIIRSGSTRTIETSVTTIFINPKSLSQLRNL
jgi:uncharacterized protein YecE (DUF72 family)